MPRARGSPSADQEHSRGKVRTPRGGDGSIIIGGFGLRAGIRSGPIIEAERCMKVRDVTKRITADGWYYVKSRGDHHHFKYPAKPGR